MVFKAANLGRITKTVSVDREEKNIKNSALSIIALCLLSLLWFLFCFETYYATQNKSW